MMRHLLSDIEGLRTVGVVVTTAEMLAEGGIVGFFDSLQRETGTENSGSMSKMKIMNVQQ